MRRHLLALLVCVLLCLMVLPSTASADSGPKPAVTITVVNALRGSTTWICSSRPRRPCKHRSGRLRPQSSPRAAGLGGRRLVPRPGGRHQRSSVRRSAAGEDGTHRFTYYGLPRAFRIAVSGPDGAQATDEPFTRTVFYTHLTYDWETNSITRDTSPAGFYGVQFLSTLVPTLIIEGVLAVGCSASGHAGTGWCFWRSIWSPRRGSTCGLRQI